MKYQRLSEIILAGALSVAPVGCGEWKHRAYVISEYAEEPAIYFFEDTDRNGSYDYVKICIDLKVVNPVLAKLLS